MDFGLYFWDCFKAPKGIALISTLLNCHKASIFLPFRPLKGILISKICSKSALFFISEDLLRPQKPGGCSDFCQPMPLIVPVSGLLSPTGSGAPGQKSEDRQKCPNPPSSSDLAIGLHKAGLRPSALPFTSPSGARKGAVKPAAALNIGQQHKLLVGYILPYIALEGKLELSQSVVQLRQAFLWTTVGMERCPSSPS